MTFRVEERLKMEGGSGHGSMKEILSFEIELVPEYDEGKVEKKKEEIEMENEMQQPFVGEGQNSFFSSGNSFYSSVNSSVNSFSMQSNEPTPLNYTFPEGISFTLQDMSLEIKSQFIAAEEILFDKIFNSLGGQFLYKPKPRLRFTTVILLMIIVYVLLATLDYMGLKSGDCDGDYSPDNECSYTIWIYVNSFYFIVNGFAALVFITFFILQFHIFISSVTGRDNEKCCGCQLWVSVCCSATLEIPLSLLLCTYRCLCFRDCCADTLSDEAPKFSTTEKRNFLKSMYKFSRFKKQYMRLNILFIILIFAEMAFNVLNFCYYYLVTDANFSTLVINSLVSFSIETLGFITLCYIFIQLSVLQFT